jgi:hypothetical protein
MMIFWSLCGLEMFTGVDLRGNDAVLTIIIWSPNFGARDKHCNNVGIILVFKDVFISKNYAMMTLSR